MVKIIDEWNLQDKDCGGICRFCLSQQNRNQTEIDKKWYGGGALGFFLHVIHFSILYL